MINVLMVDEVSSIKAVKEFLTSKSSTNVNIKYSCSDGLEAIKLIKDKYDDFDCIVLSMVLPSLDGMGILKFLKRENLNKKVILYTYNKNMDLLRVLTDYNILFCLYKGIDLNILEERINDAVNLETSKVPVGNNGDMTKEISKLLHDLGMPSHIKGYQYIRDSIALMYNKGR